MNGNDFYNQNNLNQANNNVVSSSNLQNISIDDLESSNNYINISSNNVEIPKKKNNKGIISQNKKTHIYEFFFIH